LLGAAVFFKQKRAKREQNHKAQTKTVFGEYVLLIFNMFWYQNQNGKFDLHRRPVGTHKTAKSLSTKFLFLIDFCYLPSIEADDPEQEFSKSGVLLMRTCQLPTPCRPVTSLTK